VATAEFSKFAGILSAALQQHHLSGFEKSTEESPSKDKNKLIESQSPSQKIDDQDSTS